MFRFLVLCAICGGTLGTAAAATPLGTLREWTDASGTRRARAVLLRIEGDTLVLRRSDGKPTTTKISRISERDRQYVALRRSQSPTNSKLPSVPSSITENVTDAVETIQQLPQWLEQSQPAAESSRIPAALVYVRVSRDLLE